MRYWVARFSANGYHGFVTFGSTKEQVEKSLETAIDLDLKELREITIEEPFIKVVDTNRGSEYYETVGLINVGRLYDSKGTPDSYSFYTTPESLEKAKVAFEKESKIRKARSDAYYAQPWV